MNMQLHSFKFKGVQFKQSVLITLLGLIFSCMAVSEALAQVELVKKVDEDNNKSVRYLYSTGEDVIFMGVLSTDRVWELWKSDGTEAGTYKIKSFKDLSRTVPGSENYAYLNGKFFFHAQGLEDDNDFVYVTDGTEEGTIALHDEISSAYQGKMHVFGDYVYFQSREPERQYIVLFRSDGTSVEQITNEYLNYHGDMIVEVNDDLYFQQEIISNGLFKFDGNSLIDLWDEFGHSLIFSTGARNDDYKVDDIAYTAFNGKIIFYGVDQRESSEQRRGVFSFDPVTGNITELSTFQTVNISKHNDVELFHEKDGWLYYIHADPDYWNDSNTGKKTWLWKTDGTPEGTQQIYEFDEDLEESYNSIALVLFQGSTDTHLFMNFHPWLKDVELYSLNYATEEVSKVHTYESDTHGINGKFVGENNTNSFHIWADHTDEALYRIVLHTSSGTPESIQTYPLSLNGEEYGIGIDEGTAILQDSLFYFVGGLESTETAGLMVFNTKNSTQVGDSEDEEVPDTSEIIFFEDFEDLTDFPNWYLEQDNDEYKWEFGTVEDLPFSGIDENSPTSAYVSPTSSEGYGIIYTEDLSFADYDTVSTEFHVLYDSASDLGRLVLYAYINDSYEEVWRAPGDSLGLKWREVVVDLSEYAGKEGISLTLEYFNRDPASLVAIDNFTLKSTLDEVTDSADLIVQVERSFGESSLPDDYRLLALPGQVDETLGNILKGSSGIDWQAYWDNGAEENYLQKYDGSGTFTVIPGNGFWVTSKELFQYEQTLPAVKLNDQNQTQIKLHEGWNIISNPLDIDVSWELISSANENSLQPIWEFDGSFSEATEFTSAANGEAFYFLNDGGLEELTIPYTPASNKEKVPGDQQMLKLITTVDGSQTSLSSLKFLTEDQTMKPDVVAPPSGFEGASLRFANSVEQKYKRLNLFARIDRKHQPEGQQFPMRLTANPEQPVVIKAEIMDSYQLEELALLDLQTGKTYDLLSPQGVQYAPQEKSTDLLLVMGDSQYLEEQQSNILPEQVSIKPNYPNPFNPTTTLQFALPEQTEVRVQVYDMIGRQVATLINNEVREAGIHNVTFDASRQASGLYFAVFEIGQQRFTQKMMLIK